MAIKNTAAALQVLAAVGSSQNVSSQERPRSFIDGVELLSLCLDPEDGPFVTHGYCMGYISGIADAMGAGSEVNGYAACFPEGVAAGNLRDVVVRWLSDNPQAQHNNAEELVAEALSVFFPCTARRRALETPTPV